MQDAPDRIRILMERECRMITAQRPPLDVSIPSAGGTILRGWHWAQPNPRGVLLIAHGFGEHSGAYRHVAEALGPALEIDVVAVDLRGHGRSPGRRGVVRRYEDMIADVGAALAWSARERPGLPLFLLGHSNGGLLALRLALELDRYTTAAPSGLILSNPSIQIVTPIPPAKLALGRLLLRFAPGTTLPAKLDPALLTRDPEIQREHETDPLRHSRISPPLFFGMAGSGPIVIRDAEKITLPLLLILGGSDPVIDSGVSRRVFDRIGSPDKAIAHYPTMRHEPLNEIGRDEVFTEIRSWLDPRLAREDAPPATSVGG
jgi:alpha-beta hydrolase superfamily lysophospholipase